MKIKNIKNVKMSPAFKSNWYRLHNNAIHFYERDLPNEITEKYLIKNR